MRAHPQVHIRARPNSPRTPAEQDYEESPRHASATGLHDPVTPTHAHSSAQDRGPAQGQWWQRWTHTQLWELRKWARGEPSLEGLVHRFRKGSVENCASGRRGGGCRRPHGKPCWPMRSTPWESTPATSPRPKDHPYVLRRLRETLQETQRDGIRLWDITRSPAPHTHTPSPPHKRRRTNTGGTHSTPGALAPHNTTRLTPRPAAPPPNPVTQQTATTGRHTRPRPAVTKRTGR